jgi:ubiquinone/menaquinone biosynthesis C-methylase UbiE
MIKIVDQDYLLNNQYRDATHLDARVQLHQRFSTNPYGWNRWYFDQLNLPPQATLAPTAWLQCGVSRATGALHRMCAGWPARRRRILELGCGPGYLWRDNLDRLPTTWDVTLSDFSAGMVQQAQAKLGHLKNFRFEIIDAQSIPLEAGHFDAVIANFMLYHVPDRSRALSEMRRVLKAKGAAYIATSGNKHLHELHDLMQRFDPQTDFGWGKRVHEVFSLDSGSTEIAQHFARVATLRYVDSLIVTEVEPLVAYILSMTTIIGLAEARRAELTRFIESELAAHGSIFITKDSGLFMAHTLTTDDTDFTDK